MPGILARVQSIVSGHWSTTTGPTKTHRSSFDMAARQFGVAIGPLRKLVEKDVPALAKKLEAAKAPWTPGRKIPVWKGT